MAMRPHEDLFNLGMKLRRGFIDSYSVISQNILKLLAKVWIIPYFFVFLHSQLTNVDSCHDSTNHASILVLAAPRISDTL